MGDEVLEAREKEDAAKMNNSTVRDSFLLDMDEVLEARDKEDRTKNNKDTSQDSLIIDMDKVCMNNLDSSSEDEDCVVVESDGPKSSFKRSPIKKNIKNTSKK